MRIFLLSDSHFGHDRMIEYCGRPENFNEKIYINLIRMIEDDDILIHLGDVCMKNDLNNHNKYIKPLRCRKWLVRGNHDRKSNSWYLDNGWDFVCEKFDGIYFGERILFSHFPQPNGDYKYNIFGHFHNNELEKCEQEYVKRMIKGKHKCFVLENLKYEPVLLERFLKL